MESSKKTELDWQAFRYIAGEMSDDETGQFEELLAVDQNAREAVARSVEVAQAVAVSSIETVYVQKSDKPASSRNWSSMAVVAVAAICLVLVVSLSFFPAGPNGFWANRDVDDVTPTAGVTTADLLLAFWTDAEATANEWIEENRQEPSVAEEIDSFELDSDSSEDTGAELTVPAWMIAAVSTDYEPDPQNPDDGPLEN